MWFKSPSLKHCLQFLALALAPATAPAQEATDSSPDFCTKLDTMYQKYRWGSSACDQITWKSDTFSEKGVPLVHTVFGEQKNPRHTTLVMAGIHGDEPTPVFVAMALARSLTQTGLADSATRVVIAPIINPDGFLLHRRTNANGVDLNRNFPTADWDAGAIKLWIQRRKRSPAHFPGHHPGTEQGTKFQMALIDAFAPDKIISIHSPLGFVDYDGPGDSKSPARLSDEERKALQIAKVLAGTTRKKVVDYPFFPGSLGNYAGNERLIPTITLEFGSSRYKMAASHWREFEKSLKAAVEFEFHKISLAETGKKAVDPTP